MHNLAEMYQNGYGVERDLDMARQLYEEAAALGSQASQERLDAMAETPAA